MAKYDVKVKAPPRDGFPGFYSAQKFFPGGELVSLNVNERELKELLNDDKAGLLMVEGSDSLRDQLASDPDAQNGGGTVTQSLTSEEAAALEAFRRSKTTAGAPIVQGAAPVTPPKGDDAAGKGKGSK